MNPFQVVEDFESALSNYTGAKYAVTCTSCTSAILMAMSWHKQHSLLSTVTIPRRTYVGVPQSIISAGFQVQFGAEEWSGGYQLSPFLVWDYARRFTFNMFRVGEMHCVSFHPTKILGLSGHGGAILHDNDQADEWLRRARFDGRKEGIHPKDDAFTRGFHFYMSPVTAAEGLMRLSTLPKHNEDLPNSDYSDLSTQEIFQ